MWHHSKLRPGTVRPFLATHWSALSSPFTGPLPSFLAISACLLSSAVTVPLYDSIRLAHLDPGGRYHFRSSRKHAPAGHIGGGEPEARREGDARRIEVVFRVVGDGSEQIARRIHALFIVEVVVFFFG